MVGDAKTAKDTMQKALNSPETKQKIKIEAKANNLEKVQMSVIQASIEAMVAKYGNDINKLNELNLQVMNLFQTSALRITKKEQNILAAIVTNAQEKAAVEQQKVEDSQPLSEGEIKTTLMAAEKAIIEQLAGNVDKDIDFLKAKFTELKGEHPSINTQKDVNNYINDLMEAAIDYLADKYDLSNIKEDVDAVLTNWHIIPLSEDQRTALRKRAMLE